MQIVLLVFWEHLQKNKMWKSAWHFWTFLFSSHFLTFTLNGLEIEEKKMSTWIFVFSPVPDLILSSWHQTRPDFSRSVFLDTNNNVLFLNVAARTAGMWRQTEDINHNFTPIFLHNTGVWGGGRGEMCNLRYGNNKHTWKASSRRLWGLSGEEPAISLLTSVGRNGPNN